MLGIMFHHEFKDTPKECTKSVEAQNCTNKNNVLFISEIEICSLHYTCSPVNAANEYFDFKDVKYLGHIFQSVN